MGTGIMAMPAATVDVREMLCAQALTVVAGAAGRLRAGEALEVRYNSDDVKADVLSWARTRAWSARDLGEGRLRIAPRPDEAGGAR